MLEAVARPAAAALVALRALPIPLPALSTVYVLCKSLLLCRSVVAAKKNYKIIKINPNLFVPFSPLWPQQVPPSGLLSLESSLQLRFHETISNSFIYRCYIRFGLSRATEPTKQIPTFYKGEMGQQPLAPDSSWRACFGWCIAL